MFLNLGCNIGINMLWHFLLSNPFKNIYEKVKYFQNLTFHINNQILQFCFKCIHLQIIQAIKNFLTWKFITKLWACEYDKLQSISKEPMPPTLFQDITNDNQGEYFHHYFANYPSLFVEKIRLYNATNCWL